VRRFPSSVSACAHDEGDSRQAATTPYEQPRLDNELNTASGAVGKQQRPLVAELCSAAEYHDELRRTTDGPDAEDWEDSRDASGRGYTEPDGGDDAAPSAD
jgi:hypothetical protein